MVETLIGLGVIGIALLAASFIAGEIFDGAFDNFGGDWLSGSAVAGFLGAFGFAGAAVFDATQNVLFTILAGLATGLIFGAAATYITRALMRGGDNSTVRSAGLVGLSGNVISDIPADGLGVVNVTAAGHITRLNARATEELPAGTAVIITQVLSPTSVVVQRS